MGVKELRDGFNGVAQPDATASRALLNYVPQGGTEWQVLTFSGALADGTAFEIKSDRLRPGSDVVMAAAETAKQLLQRHGIAR